MQIVGYINTLFLYNAVVVRWITILRWSPIPVAARPKAWVCDNLLAGTAGSKPSGDMNVLWVLCVDRERSVRWADPSSRGALPSVCVCVCVCMCLSLRVIRCNYSPLHLKWVERKGQTNKGRNKDATPRTRYDCRQGFTERKSPWTLL